MWWRDYLCEGGATCVREGLLVWRGYLCGGGATCVVEGLLV